MPTTTKTDAVPAPSVTGWESLPKRPRTPRRPRCEACQFARDILADTEESHLVRCTHRAVAK